MEKVTAVKVANISANAESKRGSIIVAASNAQVTSEFGTRPSFVVWSRRLIKF